MCSVAIAEALLACADSVYRERQLRTRAKLVTVVAAMEKHIQNHSDQTPQLEKNILEAKEAIRFIDSEIQP